MSDLNDTAYNLIKTETGQRTPQSAFQFCLYALQAFFTEHDLSDFEDYLTHEMDFRQKAVNEYDVRLVGEFLVNVGEEKAMTVLRLKFFADIEGEQYNRSGKVTKFSFSMTFHVNEEAHGVPEGTFNVQCDDDTKALKKMVKLLDRKKLPVDAMLKLVNGKSVT